MYTLFTYVSASLLALFRGYLLMCLWLRIRLTAALKSCFYGECFDCSIIVPLFRTARFGMMWMLPWRNLKMYWPVFGIQRRSITLHCLVHNDILSFFLAAFEMNSLTAIFKVFLVYIVDRFWKCIRIWLLIPTAMVLRLSVLCSCLRPRNIQL